MPENLLTGAKAIAKALGRSERTVRRMVKAGRLDAHKLGQNTSPYVISRKALATLRRDVDEEA